MRKTTKRRPNRGYFFRTGRGWYTKINGNFVALTNEEGVRLKDKATDKAIVENAFYRRKMAAAIEQVQPAAKLPGITVLEVCEAYLAEARASSSPATHKARRASLNDFCFGMNYGDLTVEELKPIHVDQWLQARKKWNGAKRMHIQAVKRAMSYCHEKGLIENNPLKTVKVPRSRSRATCISPEQEAKMLELARPAYAEAIQILIRTGARPGCEFAALTANHVEEHASDRMAWVFQPHESKTKKKRTLYITAPEVIAVVRRQMKQHPTGPLFRNTNDDPWTAKSLRGQFDRMRTRLKKRGIKLDDDACLYAFRHTYAKRMLEGGYWSDRPVSVETLAQLMGNSKEIIWKHYSDWGPKTDHLWAAS